MKMVLDGIRVLDLSQFFSGPWCGMLLADMGAEVIKVEPSPIGDYIRVGTLFEKGLAPLYAVFNRNKKSITLNLKKSEKAREIFRDLVKKADVVLTNALPGDLEVLHLGYEDLKILNPRLIFAAISGFGRSGLEEYVKQPAFDIVAQATGGILDALKMYEAPKIPFADINAGTYCALGILQALFYRERTGKGQFIDISMQDIMFAYNILSHISRTLRAEIEQSFSRILPLYNIFETKDGHVAIVVITEKQWHRICDVMGNPELKRDRRYNSPLKRWKRSEEVDAILSNWTQTKTTSEIVSLLYQHRIPGGEVIPFDQVQDHPQLQARNMSLDVELPEVGKSVKLPGIIIKLSESPGQIQSPQGPALGEHTDTILTELLQYSPEEIAQLRKSGAI
ncbi:MAG: CaiB/BaiF CoA transferase family protein [Candidatus Helarchaeota archaeon]